jgi:hypothetical protein
MEGGLRGRFVQEFATLQNAEVVLAMVDQLADPLDRTGIHCFGEAGPDHASAVRAIAQLIDEDDGDEFWDLAGVLYYTTEDADALRDGRDFRLTLLAGPPGNALRDDEARLGKIAMSVCTLLARLPVAVEWDGKNTVTINPRVAAAAEWLRAERARRFCVSA